MGRLRPPHTKGGLEPPEERLKRNTDRVRRLQVADGPSDETAQLHGVRPNTAPDCRATVWRVTKRYRAGGGQGDGPTKREEEHEQAGVTSATGHLLLKDRGERW